eukprot:5386633-Lingulodinium_polyedra.AAC.1
MAKQLREPTCRPNLTVPVGGGIVVDELLWKPLELCLILRGADIALDLLTNGQRFPAAHSMDGVYEF